ncbi:MAG TPA: hypothetical protein VK203_08890 [Nostocaceae cyanobacterium]|nr:hypothetical protein [Nostocaceae cyanobacterium]
MLACWLFLADNSSLPRWGLVLPNKPRKVIELITQQHLNSEWRSGSGRV